jgi:multicomponent Na+:H+ antiporter subunit B
LTNILLLTFLAVTAVSVLLIRNLFVAVILFGIYSLISAALFVVMDAVDVAFTEAAVGAGISTVLMLSTLAFTGSKEKIPSHKPLLPIITVTITGAALIYGTLDMPGYGDRKAPVHQHVAPRYIEESPKEVGVPNMVTSVLASYRGYDTMGEVAVIFCASVGVVILLSNLVRTGRKKTGDSEGEDA